MKLTLRYYGDPILRKKGAEVEKITPEIKTLVANMIETMRESNGIGIAAPQIGESLRIFISEVPQEGEDGNWVDGTLRVFINPQVVEFSPEKSVVSEGCLSIPGLNAEVERPYRVKVKALNLEGEEFTVEVEGLEAHCLLHENDHINGVLFVDRVRGKERQRLEPILKKIKQEYYLKKQ